MTKLELIARQASQIEEMKYELAFLKDQIKRVRMIMVCIGGPLNDNKLGYSKAQLVPFWKIKEELES